MRRVSWCLLLLPLFCQTLRSNVGKLSQDGPEIEDDSVSQVEELSDIPVYHTMLNIRQSSLQGVECEMKETRMLGPGLGNLKTQGILRDYDSGFFDAVKRDSWEASDLELFGICPDDNHSLVTMKHLVKILAEPQEKHLVLLQMEKVEWDSGTNLQFQGIVEPHILPLLKHTHLLALVFYPDKQMHSVESHTSKVLMSVEGEPQNQVVCMSSSTQYLVFRVRGNVKNVASSDLRVHLSVQMKKHQDGLAISKAEAQSLLFGKDKCLSRVAPVLLMVLGKSSHKEASLHTSEASMGNLSSLRESMDTLPAAEKDEFLEALSHFSSLLMNSGGKAKSSIYLPLDPSDIKVGDLRPQVFNVTEVEAMEWLVESQEPLVFFFLPGSKCLLRTIFQEKFNGTLLEKMTMKIQEVLEELEEILSDGERVQVLQSLLRFCHGSFNVSYLPRIQTLPHLGDCKHKKLNSLMLLKVLQAIRSYWQDRKKLSRQYRGAGIKSHCRLQELIISLKPYAEYKDIHFPEEININNCVGPCRFPQTTQNEYQAHVVLLIQLQEKKQPELDRPPCCVPVKYQGQWLMIADENGLRLQLYPNMVAKECGCR